MSQSTDEKKRARENKTKQSKKERKTKRKIIKTKTKTNRGKASQTNIQIEKEWVDKTPRQVVKITFSRQEHPRKLTCQPKEKNRKKNERFFKRIKTGTKNEKKQ